MVAVDWTKLNAMPFPENGGEEEGSEPDVSDRMLELGPVGDARRMLAVAHERLAVVWPQKTAGNAKSQCSFAVADTKTGLWCIGQPSLLEVLREAGNYGRRLSLKDYMQTRTQGRGDAERDLGRRMNYFDRAVDSAYLAKAGAVSHVALAEGLDDGEPWGGVRVIVEHEFDAQTRYLGADNGVIDLATGKLLPPEEGLLTFTTMTVGYDFDPDATHIDVDKLLDHPTLDKESAAFVTDCEARSLRGKPLARIYSFLDDGDGDTGKTTRMKAVLHTLGEYGETLALDALKGSRGDKTGQASPELAPLAVCRYVFVEEAGAIRLNEERIKAISGGAPVKYRLLFENFQTRPVIASVWAASNGRLGLDLSSGAVARRYVPLLWPVIPEELRDARLKRAFEPDEDPDAARRKAFLAVLVRRCVEVPDEPPLPDAVAARLATHRAESMGSVGAWIESRLIKVHGSRVAFNDAYHAMLNHLGETEGDISKSDFSQKVKAVLEVGTKPLRINGIVVKGWEGLALLPTPADGGEDGPDP